MPRTPPNNTQPSADGSDGSASPELGGRRRLARRLRCGVLVVVLAAVALIAAAVLPGSHQTGTTTAVLAQASVAPSSSPRNTLKVHQSKVFDSNISARKYGTQIADREAGVNTSGQMTSDLSPLPARSFHAPVAAYKRYAERWAIALGSSVGVLTAALRSGNRAAAKRDWNAAFSDYLHLGAVYGLLPGKLNDRLAEVPPNTDARAFPGLHRIELGLWTGEPLKRLVGVADGVRRADGTLRRVMPTIAIDPLDYATRAHEILEDAQRDLMSGDDVPWSGAGVLGTAAGVAVTREVVSTLARLLAGRDNTLGESQNWLQALQRTLNGVRRPDGSWPALAQLSTAQRERVDGALAGTLSALELIPGTLETHRIPTLPSIPRTAK